MKIVILSDSFKNTLTSVQVGKILKNELDKAFADVSYYAIADGGEGTVDALLLAKNAQKQEVEVVDAHLEKLKTYYAIDDEKNAYMDVASVVGFSANANHELDVMNATTFGIGLMIKDAIVKGIKKIYLGLGGSITSDCGCGIACALGRKFYNKSGSSLIPTPNNLNDIVSFNDVDLIDLHDIEIICLCDVTNPLYGESGAAYVFAPQKGATMDDVKVIDKGLKHISKLFSKVNPNSSGMGAAGGIMFMLNSMTNIKMISGADYIIDQIALNRIITSDTILITGEGCLDEQTFCGKLISKLVMKAEDKNIPLLAVCGCSKIDLQTAKKNGISMIFTLNKGDKSLEEMQKSAVSDLKKTSVRVKEYLLNKI